MSLLDIKNYLMQVKIASLSSLCVYFNCEADTLRGMLGHWVRKGCVRQCAKSDSCSKCMQCNPMVREVYEWVA